MTDTDKPQVHKLGTLACDMVETTPFVFCGRCYRSEWVRENFQGNRMGRAHTRIVDWENCWTSVPVAVGAAFSSAHVEEGAVHVFAADKVGGSQILSFRSTDLEHWSSTGALELPGWGLYNNSVCRGDGRYVMAVEVGEPPEVVGVRFTMRFAESVNLRDWKLLTEDCVYAKDRYTACPALRYADGWYYMIYLEHLPPWKFEPYVVRSRDLARWESSSRNPLFAISPEDKLIANPHLTATERQRVACAEDANNSDVDLCEFQGKTRLTYSWGNQRGDEFLAHAVYNGPLSEFFRGFFP